MEVPPPRCTSFCSFHLHLTFSSFISSPSPPSYLLSPFSFTLHCPPTCPLSFPFSLSSLPLTSFFPPSSLTCPLPSHLSLLVPSDQPPTGLLCFSLLSHLLTRHPHLHLASSPLPSWLRPLGCPLLSLAPFVCMIPPSLIFQPRPSLLS